MWMKTGKLADAHADTPMQRRVLLFAGPRSRTNCVCDQFADEVCSRLRPICGRFTTAAAACSRTTEAVACARTWTVRGLDCRLELNAIADCSRTRSIRGCVLSWTGLMSWKCRVCGHEPVTSRGCSAPASRPCRGRENLPPGRSKACPVLNMIGNTLPPLLQ